MADSEPVSRVAMVAYAPCGVQRIALQFDLDTDASDKGLPCCSGWRGASGIYSSVRKALSS